LLTVHYCTLQAYPSPITGLEDLDLARRCLTNERREQRVLLSGIDDEPAVQHEATLAEETTDASDLRIPTGSESNVSTLHLDEAGQKAVGNDRVEVEAKKAEEKGVSFPHAHLSCFFFNPSNSYSFNGACMHVILLA
jgi:hypothetical protein